MCEAPGLGGLGEACCADDAGTFSYVANTNDNCVCGGMCPTDTECLVAGALLGEPEACCTDGVGMVLGCDGGGLPF